MPKRLITLVKLSGLPRWLQVGVYALVGVAIGGAFVVGRMANASSYLLDDPQTCINCHVMTDAYATWQRGSHGHVTVCNDCHVPHSSFFAKWAFKSMDGMKHSTIFTLNMQPQVLELSAIATPVVQANCLRCHDNQFLMLSSDAAQRTCWDCHNNIHGEAQSLSSSPHVSRPQLPDAGLDWTK
ncbi:MAG: cytochrome c nitrite reductase small subunit [Planctomycetota bacterium]|jgi:cytochrome c nitrite reductase small subunit